MKFKRVLSAVLVLCLMLTVIPSIAWAAETDGTPATNDVQLTEPAAGWGAVDTFPLEHCHPAGPTAYANNGERKPYLKVGVIVNGKKKSAGMDGSISVKYGSQYQLYATLMIPIDHQEQTRSSEDTVGGYQEIDVTSDCEWAYPDDILDITDITMTVKAQSNHIVSLYASYDPSAGDVAASYARAGISGPINGDTRVQTKKLKLDGNRMLLEYIAACKLIAVDFACDDKSKSVKDILRGPIGNNKKITAPISKKNDSATIKEFCEEAIGNWTLVKYTTEHLSSGLYGALFYTGKQYVLVFRGTELDPMDHFFADIRQADYGIAMAHKAPQFKYAEEFYRNELSVGQKENLILAGHSLGGALCDYLSLLHHHKCYTFNAPTAMMTCMSQDETLFGRNFAGTEERNLRHDYVHPEDFVGNLVTGSGLAKIPFIGVNTTIPEIVLDKTIFVKDASGSNGKGAIGAPYHSLEQMLQYDHQNYTVMFPGDVSLGPLTPTSKSGYVPGSLAKERLWPIGPSYYYGTSGKDVETLKISAPGTNSIYVFSGDGNDDIKIQPQTLKSFRDSTICGGRGNDTFTLEQNGTYNYLYFLGDGQDTIEADRQTVQIHIYDYNEDLVKTAVSKLQNSDSDQSGYATLFLSETDSIRLDMNGTGIYKIFAGKNHVGDIKCKNPASVTSIAGCPVNMNVYDASGNLCLELIDGIEMREVRDYGTFSVYEMDGEYIKSATLYDESYRVEIVGLDTGTMDYRIEKTAGDTVEARIVEGIPVTKDAIYTVVNDFTENIVLTGDLDGDGTDENTIVYYPPEGITLNSTQKEMHYLEETPLTAAVMPAGASQQVLWRSSNTDIATVDENGVVTAVGAGSAEIVAESLADSSVIAVCQIIVTDAPIPLDNAVIDGLNASYVYTSYDIEPSLEVWYGSQLLLEGIDYSLSFENNTEIGTASVTLTGEGYVQGTITKNFDIRTPTVHEKVQLLTEECLACGAETDLEKALWLHDWLIYNADYDYSYTEYGPDGVLLKGTGVCQSYADAYSSLLTEAGIENIVVIAPEMDHAWNIVKIDGVYTHVDCTWDDPNSGGLENHTYFGLCDSEMAQEHIWDTSKYPSCEKLPFQADESNLPKPFELIDPVQGVEFTLRDKDGNTLTREQIERAGGNVLLVFGRPNCPNTMALLQNLNNLKPVLDAHNVQVVAVMEDETQVEELSEQFDFICGYNIDDYESWQFNQRIDLIGEYMYPQVVLQNSKGFAFYHSTGYVYEPEKLVATAIQALPGSEQVPYSPVYFYSNQAEMKELIRNALENRADFIKICNPATSELSNEDVDVALDYINNDAGLAYGCSCSWYSPLGIELAIGFEYKSLGDTETPIPPSGTETPAPPSGAETPALLNGVKRMALSKSNYVYDGKAKKPAVIVIDNKGNKISKEYYTVFYRNNKKVGKATVTVKLKNGYSGTLKKNFTIKPKGTKLTSLTGKPKSISTKWAKQKIQTTGYQLQYSTDSKFSKKATVAKIVKKNITTKLTAKKLKPKKTYYVRIRTYKIVNRKKYYSTWSKVKRVKTKK